MRVALLDGTCVVIRPIEADDRHALAQGHGQLSSRSQFNRYLAFKPQLSARELDYLTQIDHRDHEALIAIDPSAGHTVVGVARYVRIAPGIEAISVLTRLGPTTRRDLGDEVQLQIELSLQAPSPPAA